MNYKINNYHEKHKNNFIIYTILISLFFVVEDKLLMASRYLGRLLVELKTYISL